jgi:molybdate transport system ATP-binding protein
LTVIDVIAAGFEDKISPSQLLSRNQKSNINTWLSSVGLRKKANEPLSRLSTGEQKIVLWIRALVKSPELLLLDEPYQGLDLNTIRKLNALLDEWIHPQQSLLFITHYNYEMPNCIQKIWKMEGQKINQQIL